MTRMRLAFIVLGLALVLGIVNWEILAKREVLANGATVLIELRPVDPRSLIQGDYMALAFADYSMPDSGTISGMPFRGTVILSLNANRVARFQRLDDGGPLGAQELRVRYRRYKDFEDRIAYNARSYFFQEGLASRYAAAKYAILRVDNSGASVLFGLADENLKLIGPSGPASIP